MQKLFQNKSITQKIIIAIVFVILFNFTCPCIVQAGDFNFIYQALSWLIVRVTDCAQWIMLLCLTMDSSMIMDHAEWDGEDTNKDKWEFEWFRNKKIEWPQRHILAPDDIFTGKILLTNINFFTDYTKKANAIGSEKTDFGSTGILKKASLDFSSDSTAESLEKLRVAIAKWYVTIRNITIVGLLSVLVYVAIRMVISSAAQDKSKYQKMLTDWLVSLCLVFTLHYIMAITIGVCEKLTNILNDNINTGVYLNAGDRFKFDGVTYGDREGTDTPLDNLSAKIRIYTQSSNSTEALSYALMYLGITIWTAIYFVIYMKRFVFMAFYTLAAPIVALTYPIDRIGDGRSQAFNDWLKEYIYTALKQPFHLILYTVFIGMAKEIADSNFIYTFVILWAMVQLDGTLAKWIGVDAASSTGTGIKEGAQKLLALRGVTSLVKGNSSGGSGSGGSGGSGTSGSTNTKPRIKGTSELGGNPTPPIRQARQQQTQPGQPQTQPGQPQQQPGQQQTQPGQQQPQPGQPQTQPGQPQTQPGQPQTQQSANTTAINRRLAKYKGSRRFPVNKQKIKGKVKNFAGTKLLDKWMASKISQNSGKAIRFTAKKAGQIAKFATVGTATLAGLMTGGIEGAASFKGTAEEFTGTIEKHANSIKNKGSRVLNDYVKSDYTQQLDKMAMATKEEKETMDKEYEGYGGRNSRAAAKMADLAGLDVINDPKAVKQRLGLSNEIMQSDPLLSPEAAMAITAEADKYASYSRKDDSTVERLINESGTPYPERVLEAWKCLQDFTGQRKYNP